MAEYLAFALLVLGPLTGLYICWRIFRFAWKKIFRTGSESDSPNASSKSSQPKDSHQEWQHHTLEVIETRAWHAAGGGYHQDLWLKHPDGGTEVKYHFNQEIACRKGHKLDLLFGADQLLSIRNKKTNRHTLLYTHDYGYRFWRAAVIVTFFLVLGSFLGVLIVPFALIFAALGIFNHKKKSKDYNKVCALIGDYWAKI